MKGRHRPAPDKKNVQKYDIFPGFGPRGLFFFGGGPARRRDFRRAGRRFHVFFVSSRSEKHIVRYGIETRTLQYALAPQGGVRTPRAGPCGHVRLRPYGLRRSPPGPRPPGRDVRSAVPLPQGLGLQGALRAQHHRRGASGARRRRGRGQDRQEGAPRAARTHGGGPLLHRALPPCDGGAGRREPLDRAPRLGPHHRADRLRAAHPRRRLRLRLERLGLFRRGEVQRPA